MELVMEQEAPAGEVCLTPEAMDAYLDTCLLYTSVVTCLFLAGSIALTLADGVPYLAAAFEVASAMGTVGLTMGITTGLSPLSQGIIIAMMFLGRVGVLSFSIAFLIRDRGENKIRYPSVDVRCV